MISRKRSMIAESNTQEGASNKTAGELVDTLQTGLEQAGTSATGVVWKLTIDRDD